MQDLAQNPLFLAVLIISALNLGLIVVLFWRQWKYRVKHRELFDGVDTENIEEILAKHKKQLKNHAKNLKELGEILSELVEGGKLHVQQVGLVRYNPFEDTGSNMSFALALLDGRGSGLVVSSLHSRDGTRIYAKAVERGKSKHNLTEEEESAIKQAKNKK